MSGSKTSQLVAEVKKGVKKLDTDRLVRAISDLVAEEPKRWHQLLMFAGLWPDPTPQRKRNEVGTLPETLGCLMEVIDKLMANDRNHVEVSQVIYQTLSGFIKLQQYYMDVSDELNEMAFFTSPAEVQIHRLLAFIESQSRNIENELRKLHDVAAVVDPLARHRSIVPAKVGQTRGSYTEAFDGACEIAELVLRFILHSNKLAADPAFQPTNVPYKDSEYSGPRF